MEVWYGFFRLDDLRNLRSLLPAWGWFAAECEGCGRQTLVFPWRGKKRCRDCGPGDGLAPCPATHTEKPCPLCRGNGFVEAL